LFFALGYDKQTVVYIMLVTFCTVHLLTDGFARVISRPRILKKAFQKFSNLQDSFINKRQGTFMTYV